MSQLSLRYCLFLLLAIPMVMAMTSCSKEEPIDKTPSSAPEQSPVPDTPAELPSTLAQLKQSDFYTIDEFPAAVASSPTFSSYLGGNESIYQVLEKMLKIYVMSHSSSLDSAFTATVGRDASGAKQWGIETHSFTYNSIDVSGHPVVLSGRVSFPNNTVANVDHKVSTFSLISHQMVMDNEMAPSAAITIMSLRTLWNSAVIEPDYQGVGVDFGLHGYSTLTYHALARQMSDCIMAALAIMRQRGVGLADDGYTTNWGQSLGAPAAMAYAYRYENVVSELERQAVRLSSTFAGEGPSNLLGSFTYGMSHPEFKTSFGDYLRYFINMGEELMHGWKIADFAPEWMVTPVIPYEGKMCSYLEAMMGNLVDRKTLNMARPEDYVSSDPKLNFSPAMLDSTGWLDPQSPTTQAFLSIMEEQSSFQGWHPLHELYLSHSQNDDFMPYLPARMMYEELHAVSPATVFWLEAPIVENGITDMVNEGGLGGMTGRRSSSSMGVHMVISAMALLYMCCSEEPADMAQFYPLTD